tara:strand:- start:4043 stop:5344 length:1302 start_codon:yes stop_codon:yes gene_type:complete
MDRKFFFFRREPESETSSSFSDTGVGLSTIAIPSENLTFITTAKKKVVFTFKDCNGFDESNLIQGESVPKATITISCKEGEEANLIESVINFMSRDTPKNIMKFDVVNNESTFKEAVMDELDDVVSVIPATPINTATKSLSKGDSTHETANTIDGIYFNESKPIIDYNHAGLSAFTNTSAITSWANAGTGGSTYNLGPSLGVSVAVTTAGESTLIEKAASIGSSNTFRAGAALTVSDDYTVYAVMNTNGIATTGDYGIGSLYGDLAGESFGFGSRPQDDGVLSSTNNTFKNVRNTFAVRHKGITGYPAFVSTTDTDGTKSVNVPDVDVSSINYNANNVFIIRRDPDYNMYLHDRTGDIIAKIPAKTSELDPSLTASSPGRTDGDFEFHFLSESNGVSISAKVYLNRFGVITRDVGPNEAANLARQLFDLYGKK